MVHLIGRVRHDLAVLPSLGQLHSLLFGRSVRSNRFIQALVLLAIRMSDQQAMALPYLDRFGVPCLPKTPSLLPAKELRFLTTTRFRGRRKARIEQRSPTNGHSPGIDNVLLSSRLLNRPLSRCKSCQAVPRSTLSGVFSRGTCTVNSLRKF